MNHLINGAVCRVSRLAITVAVVFIAIGGCAQEQQPEDIARSVHALGSTKPQVTINNWTGLTQMVSDGNYLLGEGMPGGLGIQPR